MDALKQQLLRVQQQLAGLSASQKMLTASLLVIMVMTLFYWSHFAATTEMEVVATPAAADVEAVKTALASKNIKFELQGDRVMVPTASKLDAQAALSFNTSLPAPTDKILDDALSASNPFENPSARDARMQVAHQKWLGQVMARWPGVTNADVMLDGETKLGVLHKAEATATVNLTVAPGKDARQIAEAARSFVSRSQAGLDAKNVGVVINGHEFNASDGDNPFDGMDSQLAAQSQSDTYWSGKVSQQINIPGAKVTVTTKFTTESSITTEHKIDPKQHLEQLQHSNETSDNNTPAAPTAEPGVVANVGVPDAPVASAGASSEKETKELTNAVDHSTSDITTKRPAGQGTPASCAVSIPESYLRNILRRTYKNADPSPEDIQKMLDVLKPSIRDSAMSALALAKDAPVTVTRFFDLEDPAPADATAGTALAAMPIGVGFGAKEMAIGALAVLSLFMVMMMVRKSAPQPVLAASGPTLDTHDEPIEAHSTLLTVNEMVGEVGEGVNTMAGHELSDEQLEAKQVIEQVGSMVKSNPDSAAALVKRWLNQD